MSVHHECIDESAFVGEDRLREWCDVLGEAGLRGTASAAHERVIEWVEQELRELPGVAVRSDPFEVLRWLPRGGELEGAGVLRVTTAEGDRELPVAGAVPYSKPGDGTGEVVHVPGGEAITADNAAGKVVLRDFPPFPLPYDLLFGAASHLTPDLDALRGEVWDRPGLADPVLFEDLVAAGRAGAAGVVVAFDVPREQVAGYFEPHRGTHYHVPAVFVGADEREELRRIAGEHGTATVGVRAEVAPARTRNVHATLPGQVDERIVLVTHTDGNTWVQENGVAALLGLATHFASLPVEQRHRTLEFAFTSGHLHISREGSVRYAKRLDEEYEGGTVAFAFAIEHLGTREIVPVHRDDGPGRRLEMTEAGEIVLWAVGPSEALRTAVVEAVERRDLDRVAVAPGLGPPVPGQVPEIVSFGGIGTAYHNRLVPTTSIITGPWSLWAPWFGADAIDVGRLRAQALAAGDVVVALDTAPMDAIAGGYLDDRTARAAGAPTGELEEPPEVL